MLPHISYREKIMDRREAILYADDYAMIHGSRPTGTFLNADALEDPVIFPELIEEGIVPEPPANCLKVWQVLDYSHLVVDLSDCEWILPEMVDYYQILKENHMTIQELISKVQEEKPNTFSNEKMLSFVNEIEQDVATQLVVPFTPYETVNDNKLIAPAPYDRLYVSYLKAMVDYANEEYASYQMNQMQHIQDFRDFVDWIVRENKASEEHVLTTRFRNIF